MYWLQNNSYLTSWQRGCCLLGSCRILGDYNGVIPGLFTHWFKAQWLCDSTFLQSLPVLILQVLAAKPLVIHLWGGYHQYMYPSSAETLRNSSFPSDYRDCYLINRTPITRVNCSPWFHSASSQHTPHAAGRVILLECQTDQVLPLPQTLHGSPLRLKNPQFLPRHIWLCVIWKQPSTAFLDE